ncbi:hypothetical protein [Psychrobacter okhotskensis]|uniref:hypothetical protein n=1 Tax=Psychrobacter okhotskensis TaxID=212403 RepID=UPI0019186CA9|nr:hypothetical protein [Psychrobacter okhotskensis]
MRTFKNLLWLLFGFILCLIGVSTTGFEVRIPVIDLTTFIDNPTVATAAASLATVAIAFLTFIMAAEARALRFTQYSQMEEARKESIRPLIEIFIEQSENYFHVFNIRVENLGKGIAQDISFKLKERETPLSESEKYLLDRLNDISFFKKSIQVLGLGKSRGSFLFTSEELYSNFGSKAFEACMSFEIVFHDSEGLRYTTHSVIDISEFDGVKQVGINPVFESYKDLKNISKNISSIANGKKLNINLHIPTKEERKRRKEFDREIYKHLNIPNNRLLRYIKDRLGL